MQPDVDSAAPTNMASIIRGSLILHTINLNTFKLSMENNDFSYLPKKIEKIKRIIRKRVSRKNIL